MTEMQDSVNFFLQILLADYEQTQQPSWLNVCALHHASIPV
jgi:hypothetical protein